MPKLIIWNLTTTFPAMYFLFRFLENDFKYSLPYIIATAFGIIGIGLVILANFHIYDEMVKVK